MNIDLSDPFWEFVASKAKVKGRTPTPQEVHTCLKNAGFTDEWVAMFEERFITPFKGLTIPQLQAISRMQTRFAGNNLTIFSVERPIELNALEWTILHVSRLSFLDFDVVGGVPLEYKNLVFDILRLNLSPGFLTPYEQCSFCGRTGTQPNGKPFRGRLTQGYRAYCHFATCPKESVYPLHKEEKKKVGCCFWKWQSAYHKYKQRWIRSKNDRERLKAFRAICEDLYQNNLRISQPIHSLYIAQWEKQNGKPACQMTEEVLPT